MVRRIKIMLAACAALAGAAAGAETLPVEGVYPAGNDDAASLQVIAVEPFGGVDGAQLGIAIADRLRAVSVDGEPYFRIVPGSRANDADAVLQGTAAAEISRRDASPREERSCVERDAKDKCIRRVTDKIPCWEIVARFDPAIRLVSLDGDLLYALDQPEEQSQRYCRDEERPSGERLVEQLAVRLADRVRADLAPVQRFEEFRVLETRKGLGEADGRAFRDAIRLTKTDHAGACSAWLALEPRNASHLALLFNLGLCAESRGELEQAEAYYRRALAADRNSASARQGLERLEARRRANEQLASHHAG